MSEKFAPGAPAAAGGIPLSVPEISGREWAYVKECLDTGWVSSVGPFVDRFERELAAIVGAPDAVATASGTAALHVALLVAGVQANDEVLMPALTFIAPANAVRYIGAWPVFIGAEPRYLQMDPERVREFLQDAGEWRGGALWNRRTGRRIAAIMVVDVLGHPSDVDAIRAAVAPFDLPIVEDATESLGARYKGANAGRLGDIGCFSFNGNKLVTTGGGGMIVTDRIDWARRARYLTTQAKDDPVEFVHGEVGFNYRLTNVQAAIGCAQLERLPEFIQQKRSHAAAYAAALGAVPGLTLMNEADWAFSAFWLYTIRVDEARCGVSSRDVMAHLGRTGIQARPLWQPLHRSPAHVASESYGCDETDLIVREALSLPSSVGLTPASRARVIDAVVEAVAAAP